MRYFINTLFVFVNILLLFLWPEFALETEAEDFLAPQQQEFVPRLVERNRQLASDAESVRDLLNTHAWDADGQTVSKISGVIVRESSFAGVDPLLTASVMIIECPWLDNTCLSPVGAYGVMQIMPTIWADTFSECSDYQTLEGNICIGVRVLKHYLNEESTIQRALLSYNGCLSRGPHCISYPDKVLARL